MAAHFPPYTKPTQKPTGAYRSSDPTDNATRAVIQAMQRLASASELLSDAIDLLRKPTVVQPNPQTAKQSYDAQTRRDVSWSVQRGDFSLPKWHVDFGKPRRDDLPPNLAASVRTPLEPTRIATPAELADLRQLLTAEELKGLGIGGVPAESKATLRVLANEAQTLGLYDNPHPMHAEALRQADEFERGDKETGV